MQTKHHGIVLRTVRYGDTKVIADLYTLEHGRMSVIAPSTRRKRGSGGMSMWQPLSMLEFTADTHPSGNRLPRPTEVTQYYLYTHLPYSPVKTALAMFLTEFLCSALREEGENQPLYTFMESSLQWLDMTNDPTALANYHIVFVTQISRYIGIWPNTDTSGPYFDLQAACHTTTQPLHSFYLPPSEARYMRVLFHSTYTNIRHLRLTRSARIRILNVLNDYFRLHVPMFPELRSIAVLHELFN